MELISKLLFWVANSLLIPDIIILLCLFVRSLILIGGTYNMYMTKRKNDKALDQLIKDARIDDLKAALPDKDNSLYMGYLRDLLYHPASADYSDFLITKFENEAEKDVSLSKMLAKIGPVLGLIGMSSYSTFSLYDGSCVITLFIINTAYQSSGAERNLSGSCGGVFFSCTFSVASCFLTEGFSAAFGFSVSCAFCISSVIYPGKSCPYTIKDFSNSFGIGGDISVNKCEYALILPCMYFSASSRVEQTRSCPATLYEFCD